MAYTGSGTSSDPYVVSTFADLLTCIDIANSYVKIAADLDAAAEGYEYINGFVIKCLRLYADERKSIKNVTVKGQYMMQRGTGVSATPTIDTLDFENWYFKANANSPRLFSAIGSSQFMYFADCKISAGFDAGGSYATVMAYIKFMRCALNLTIHNGSEFYFHAESSGGYADSFTNCNVVVSTNDTPIKKTGQQFLQGATSVGFVLIGFTIQATTMNFLSTGDGYGYVVFKSCTINTTLQFNVQKATNLLCFDETDATNITYNSGNKARTVTPEQLRSESYLQEIGWLP